MRKFKCYVRNKSRPEGSIAEGYIIEECMLFCSKYLHDIETRFTQLERNADEDTDDYQGLSIFAPCGTPLGKAKCRSLSEEELTQVQEYVIKNCEEAQGYLKYDFFNIFLNIFKKVKSFIMYDECSFFPIGNMNKGRLTKI